MVPTAHNVVVGFAVAILSLMPARRAGQLRLRPSREVHV